jgi:hypothetical protein
MKSFSRPLDLTIIRQSFVFSRRFKDNSMALLQHLKEEEVLDTPLLLFECDLGSGFVERWSTHHVFFLSHEYEARIVRHNVFQITAPHQDGVESSGKLSLTLANADSHFSQLERSAGFRGARLKVSFVFFDLAAGTATCDPIVIFVGRGDSPELMEPSEFRVSFSNRLNMQRQNLPSVRIQSRCPWIFPATSEQRAEASMRGQSEAYSAFFNCGYSPDQPGGCGNLDHDEPFASCRYTRADCLERGMFREDSQNRATARFGGFEFVPASVLVRSHGDRSTSLSEVLDNRAQHNDAVPLVYGTAWIEPPIVFARNDGNLTHFEVLLGSGPIEGVMKVVVDEWELPLGEDGRDMTATGWYKVVSLGDRNGGFNPDFADASGKPEGDPHGGMAILSVVVPNSISSGKSAPRMQTLVRGLKLVRFGIDGECLGSTFSNNPAWVLLDLLRRSGWEESELDLASFAKTAGECEEIIEVEDCFGRLLSVPRFGTNLVVRTRKSVADLIRGVRSCAALYLGFATNGQLQLRSERSLSQQQHQRPLGSNAPQSSAGGWPAYEFGDGTEGRGGILRDRTGKPSLRLWNRSSAEIPNRATVEFQDQFNDYQQDSVSIVDVDDVLRGGRELAIALPCLGLPHVNQAVRVAQFTLEKYIQGRLHVSFETSVRGVMLSPGDLITVTYLKEGLDRQTFRIVSIAPGINFESVALTAQQHEDSWYERLISPDAGQSGSRRRTSANLRIPRPLAAGKLSDTGEMEFEIEEHSIAAGDGEQLELEVRFTPPRKQDFAELGVPVVDLSPTVESTGGNLPGGQTLYYAVTAIDVAGRETGPSFVVRASIPFGTDTNRVCLDYLGFAAATSGFRVYRGPSPVQMLRIAEVQGIQARFTDSGLQTTLDPTPDPSYDHANFHWRWEVLPETQASSFGASKIGSSALGLPANELRSHIVRIIRGTGAGQEALLASNSSTELTLAGRWQVIPDSSSVFVVADSTWHFGGSSTSDNISFVLPNRGGVTVHISGRAANALDDESSEALSPLTRYQLRGSSGAGTDSDVPSAPLFALYPASHSAVEITAVGFHELANTQSISSGTFTLHYWSELASPTGHSLLDELTPESELMVLAGPKTIQPNDLLQAGAEVVRVEEVIGNGSAVRVTRGYAGSPIEAHQPQSPVYPLARKVTVLPFPRKFFGSPASGSYAFPIPLGDCRIAAAELFVTNSKGDSPTTRVAVTNITDQGLRILSGGQFSLQVQGLLAVEANAAPPLIIEQRYAVRDVFATLAEPPVGAPAVVRVRVDGGIYCELTVPPGRTTSNTFDGFNLSPLAAGSLLNLEIVSVGHGIGFSPGRDLTVTVRL